MVASVEDRHGVVQRAIGAALLQVDVYEEVEADVNATGQAAIVVLAVALASALASYNAGTGAIIGGVVSAFLNWAIFAGMTMFIGTRVFGGTADWGELLRTLGFAQAPGALIILRVIPVLGPLVAFIAGIWTLVAAIVAIRQALDFNTSRAILTAISAVIVIILVSMVIGIMTGISMGIMSAIL
jgi:hypothetical protein